jgi:hypothetical protein
MRSPVLTYDVVAKALSDNIAAHHAVGENTKLDLENAKTQNDYLVGKVDSILATPASLQEAAYTKMRNDEITNGNPLAQSWPPVYPGIQGLQQFKTAHLLGSQVLAEAQDKDSRMQAARVSIANQVNAIDSNQDLTKDQKAQRWAQTWDQNISTNPSIMGEYSTRDANNHFAPVPWSPEFVKRATLAALTPDQQAGEPKRLADTAKAQGEADQKTRENDASMLASAMDAGKFDPALATLSADRQQPFKGLTTSKQILDAGMTPGVRAARDTAAFNAQTALTKADTMDRRTDILERTLLDKENKATQAKIATPAQFDAVRTLKGNAMLQSQQKLQSDIAKARTELNKNPTDAGAKEAFDEAWTTAQENHNDRLQTIQNNYEERISGLTQSEVPHDNWADVRGVPPSPRPQAEIDAAAAKAQTPATAATEPQSGTGRKADDTSIGGKARKIAPPPTLPALSTPTNPTQAPTTPKAALAAKQAAPTPTSSAKGGGPIQVNIGTAKAPVMRIFDNQDALDTYTKEMNDIFTVTTPGGPIYFPNKKAAQDWTAAKGTTLKLK